MREGGGGGAAAAFAKRLSNFAPKVDGRVTG